VSGERKLPVRDLGDLVNILAAKDFDNVFARRPSGAAVERNLAQIVAFSLLAAANQRMNGRDNRAKQPICGRRSAVFRGAVERWLGVSSV
jgi:hypothetical protein